MYIYFIPFFPLKPILYSSCLWLGVNVGLTELVRSSPFVLSSESRCRELCIFLKCLSYFTS